MTETTLFDVVIVLAGGVIYAAKWWSDRRDHDGDPVEEIHRAYRDGEIDERELERRLALTLDPEAERIRETIEPINGVGPATSAAVAERFDSLEQLEVAEPDELEAVHGVGPSTAEAIRDRLSG